MQAKAHQSGGAATIEQQNQPLQALRFAGVCMHLTSLPGPNGVGELGEHAHRFVDQLAEAGLNVWQFLPTGPTAYGDSPYQPLSAYAGNPILVCVDELVALGLLAPADTASLHELPVSCTDYGPVICAKTRLLKQAADRFAQWRDHPLQSAFGEFVAEYDASWLHDYALFRALKTRHGERPWTEWEQRYRQRDAEALAQVSVDDAGALHAIKFTQFMFYRQWAALRQHAAQRGVVLFGDMPIYIALDCADAWANGDLLRIDENGVPGHVAGVPPDYFSEDGQLWGNPLYDWDYHRATQFAWWIARMRHTLSMVDIVRIDHFRGFEAFWAVPYGAPTAKDGAWEPGPADAVFDAMREALGELPIVAEDLGAITPAVDELRMRQRMPGMAVLQFMIGDHQFDATHITNDSVAYTGTHDNDTTVGWFHGGPGDVRTADQIASDQHHTLSKTGSSHDDVHWGLINTALHSAACLAIVPMQDFLGLGSQARFNTPGNPADNWRWRLGEGDFDAPLRQRILDAVRAAGR